MRKIPLSRPFLAGLLACQVLFALGCGGDDPQNLNACQTAADCSDHDACTTDVCSAGKCSNPAVAVDDGDACTADACDATDGVSHTPVAVDDGDACTADACDAATGQVSHTPVAVDDGDACTADACDAATGQVSHTPVTVDDGDACTADACDASTGTVSHTPVSVDDGDACTADACDPTTGVSHTPAAVDDGDACTTDSCDAATGTVSHAAVNPDDGNVCTTDACDPSAGVSHTAISVDDGDFCTVDACDSTSGVSHSPLNPDDGVSCTADSCDPATGPQNVPVDQACPAGQYCDPSGCASAGASQQAGTVVISEFEAFGQQFVELYNPSTTDAVDVHGFTLENAAGQLASLRAPSDPNGTAGDPVSIPAQGFAYGVVNPSGIMPPGIAFVYGAPGDAFTLSSTGDVLAIFSAQGGKLEDVVDFSTFHTDPDTAMGATDFPGYGGRSTQVDPAHLTAADNDSGANWCTTFYPAGSRARVIDTAGAANGSCNTAVINEALIDVPSTDDGLTFVEIAGPGGMLVGGATIQDTEGKGTSAGNANGVATLPAGTRIPVDGFLIVADETGSTGTTAVANVTAADVIVNDMDPENGGTDALQLVAADGTTLLDVLGDDPAGADLAVATNGFGPLWEGSTAIYVDYGAALARDAVSTDSGNNSVDFIGETDPTPGMENAFTPVTITGLTPDNGLYTASTSGVVVTGTGFGPDAMVTFGAAAPVSCTFNNSTQLTCNSVPASPTAAERVDVTVTNSSGFGNSTATLTGGWTWTGVANGTPGAVNWCDIQWPASTTTQTATQSESIFGQVYQAGITDAAGDNALIRGDVGYGPQSAGAATDPTISNDWRYTPMSFNTTAGNNYEYMASLLAPAPATYNYVVRFSRDDGLNYTYCDTDNAGDFSTASLGVWTVTP